MSVDLGEGALRGHGNHWTLFVKIHDTCWLVPQDYLSRLDHQRAFQDESSLSTLTLHIR